MYTVPGKQSRSSAVTKDDGRAGYITTYEQSNKVSEMNLRTSCRAIAFVIFYTPSPATSPPSSSSNRLLTSKYL